MLDTHQKLLIEKQVDLRLSFTVSITEQGLLNSCIACALSTAVDFIYQKKSRVFNDSKQHQSSTLFIYYHMRLIENKLPDNIPLTVDESVKALIENGVCSEQLWPYPETINPDQFKEVLRKKCYPTLQRLLARKLQDNTATLDTLLATLPPPKAAEQAKIHSHFTADKLSIDNGLNELKHCLVDGLPFIFGFEQHPTFFFIPKNGKLVIPPTSDERLGGHVVICLGFNDDEQHFICQNSYGNHYGDNGYFYVPYEFITGSFYRFDGTEVANTFGFWSIDLLTAQHE